MVKLYGRRVVFFRWRWFTVRWWRLAFQLAARESARGSSFRETVLNTNDDIDRAYRREERE